MKPHEISQLVNELTKVAREFHGAQQLRDRISQLVVSALALPDSKPMMVDICPPATSRDRWMFEQGRLAERDPRSHAQPIDQVTSGAAPDMVAICAALGFDPTNHHNAAKCPYCTPQLHLPLRKKDPHAELRETWREGQRWQVRGSARADWSNLTYCPEWFSNCQYRQHPNDLPRQSYREAIDLAMLATKKATP